MSCFLLALGGEIIKRVTIKDVAKHANVSNSTVSHVLNNTRFVRQETRERVLHAVTTLGYSPSVAARSLTTNRTQIVGVLIPNARNSFFGEILSGIEEVLRPANYGLVVCNTDEIWEREAHYLDLLLRLRVDGILATAATCKWHVQADAHTPIVFFDRSFEGMDAPFVGINNHKAAYQATCHLIEHGHRKIGLLLGEAHLSTGRERFAGFRQALQEHDIELREQWVVPSIFSIEGGYDATQHILSLPERPTALLLNNNFLSVGALLALKDLGLHCPQDVSLIGFDDHPWAAISDPPLTVMRQPTRKIGQISAQSLLDMINEGARPTSHIILQAELVERQSCRRPSPIL